MTEPDRDVIEAQNICRKSGCETRLKSLEWHVGRMMRDNSRLRAAVMVLLEPFSRELREKFLEELYPDYDQ